MIQIVGAIGALVALAITTAQAQELSPEQLRFLARHSDHTQTLQLEAEFYAALKSQDLDWIRSRAARFSKEDQPVLAQIQNAGNREASTAVAFKSTSCHYASIVLHRAIAHVAKAKQPKSVPSNPAVLVPLELRELFQEHMRRCELVHRHPWSTRLLGNQE